MSVARRAAAARWVAVAAGVAALCALPTVVAALPVGAAAPASDPRETLARAVAAAGSTPHEGLAEVRGSLGLPDLPRLESATELLGDTTRARVWWESAQRWRVAVLQPAGERNAYQVGDALVEFDYERGESRTTIGETPVRLPRADDLLPAQVVPRLLRVVAPQDQVSDLPARRVGGRAAIGLRMVPADGRSTVGSVDVWADETTLLPLRVEIRGRFSTRVAFVSEFLAVSVHRPSPDDLALRVPATAPNELVDDADVIAQYDRSAPWRLPDSLAGLPRSRDGDRIGGAAAYGTGLVRYVVVPLPVRRARITLERAREAPGTVSITVAGTEALLVQTALLHAMVVAATDDQHAYLIIGTVTDEILRAAAAELLRNPPGLR